jgi:hypothetical protein
VAHKYALGFFSAALLAVLGLVAFSMTALNTHTVETSKTSITGSRSYQLTIGPGYHHTQSLLAAGLWIAALVLAGWGLAGHRRLRSRRASP